MQFGVSQYPIILYPTELQKALQSAIFPIPQPSQPVKPEISSCTKFIVLFSETLLTVLLANIALWLAVLGIATIAITFIGGWFWLKNELK